MSRKLQSGPPFGLKNCEKHCLFPWASSSHAAKLCPCPWELWKVWITVMMAKSYSFVNKDMQGKQQKVVVEIC